MIDIIRDIKILEDLVIAISEGSSDEKRSAMFQLEKLIQEKKNIIDSFEYSMERV